MITPAFALTATERVLPKLALDFTTASLDSRITLTRSENTATRINASGIIETVNANLPRFDYDPVTLACKGLLIEESRKNLLLNTQSLATQNVTVTAVAHTLSFYGTGQVVLSGTHLATVIGTGAYPSRQTYTFTPTAGTLTITVTGTVQYAQIEAGAFATSYIPNAGSQNTRNADVVTMTGTNFSSWYNATEGSFAVQGNIPTLAIGQCFLSTNDGTAANRVRVITVTTTSLRFSSITNSVEDGSITRTIANGQNNFSIAYKLNNNGFAVNGGTTGTDTSVVVPPVNKLDIGAQLNSNFLCGHIQKISYYPQRLTSAEVQAFSK